MAAQEQHFNECFADIVNLLNVCEEKYPAGLKHRSQVRSGHRSGHRSGQVTGHRSQVRSVQVSSGQFRSIGRIFFFKGN